MHGQTVKEPATSMQLNKHISYLSRKALWLVPQFIELIPPFDFCLLLHAHKFIYSEWKVYHGERMPCHCHSAGDRAHTEQAKAC